MRKDLILTAVISTIVASTLSVVIVFASGPGAGYLDVDENAYYAEGAYSMQRLGVVEGYGNGNFGPDDYVTRGQLVTILDRYDKALLDPPWPAISGIYDLHQVVCLGGLEFNLETEGLQLAHERLCDIP